MGGTVLHYLTINTLSKSKNEQLLITLGNKTQVYHTGTHHCYHSPCHVVKPKAETIGKNKPIWTYTVSGWIISCGLNKIRSSALTCFWIIHKSTVIWKKINYGLLYTPKTQKRYRGCDIEASFLMCYLNTTTDVQLNKWGRVVTVHKCNSKDKTLR